jgi:hypothetical protein
VVDKVVGPVLGVVAGRTLDRIVLFWCPVAGSAIVVVGVVKVNFLPVRCVVAIGANSHIVGGGTVVAGSAANQATVGLDSFGPGSDIVAN